MLLKPILLVGSRRKLVQAAVRPNLIVILTPCLDDGAGIIERFKPVLVQTLLSKATIEGFNERVICRCAWAAECQFHLTTMGPFIQCLGNKLRTIVHLNHLRQTSCLRRQCELLGLNRSTFYYAPAGESAENLHLMRLFAKRAVGH